LTKAEKKLDTLKESLSKHNNAVIAFSGGVDSTFLLSVAAEIIGKNLTAVTADSTFMPSMEMKEAKEIAASLGVRHETIKVDEKEIEGFEENPPDRCYICKLHIFKRIMDFAKKNSIDCVMEASNSDDTGDYRPGMKAIRELRIQSPLLEANLTKSEIRELSRARGLPGWARPAMACLASRIPYGDTITQEKLARIDNAENFLRELGFRICRVRDHEGLARIEVKKDKTQQLMDPELQQKVTDHLKSLGFDYITVDMQGYRTGSLNERIGNISG
jgi:uncharacterized protein